MKIFNLPSVVIMECFIYGEETRKSIREGLSVIFVSEELGKYKYKLLWVKNLEILVEIMGKYSQISLLHILSLLHAFVAQ